MDLSWEKGTQVEKKEQVDVNRQTWTQLNTSGHKWMKLFKIGYNWCKWTIFDPSGHV